MNKLTFSEMKQEIKKVPKPDRRMAWECMKAISHDWCGSVRAYQYASTHCKWSEVTDLVVRQAIKFASKKDDPIGVGLKW